MRSDQRRSRESLKTTLGSQVKRFFFLRERRRREMKLLVMKMK
jgi:hypothetical protein